VRIPDDTDLLHRGQAGDESAFANLVKRHERYLFGIARALTDSLMDAEDTYQETLVAVLTGRYRGESSVRTWMVQILVRRVAMLRRSAGRWRMRLAPESADPGQPSRLDRAAEPSGQASADFRMDLAQVLKSLSPEHREVIVLREVEEMSYEQIAAVVGVPQGTIESRLHRARAELRWRMKDYS